jgi:hypothetical protein
VRYATPGLAVIPQTLKAWQLLCWPVSGFAVRASLRPKCSALRTLLLLAVQLMMGCWRRNKGAKRKLPNPSELAERFTLLPNSDHAAAVTADSNAVLRTVKYPSSSVMASRSHSYACSKSVHF